MYQIYQRIFLIGIQLDIIYAIDFMAKFGQFFNTIGFQALKLFIFIADSERAINFGLSGNKRESISMPERF